MPRPRKIQPTLQTFLKGAPKPRALANGPTAIGMVGARDLERKAFDLRVAGNSFRAIGEQCGVTTQTAYYAVMRVLEATIDQTKESSKKLREMELTRIDTALHAIWPKVEAGNEFSIDRFVKLSERRAKLTGIDAPTKLQHSGDEDNPLVIKNLSDTELERELALIAVNIGFRPIEGSSTPQTLLTASPGEVETPSDPGPKNGFGKQSR